MIGYRDVDFLEGAIGSIIDEVDELVFVDGAYSWMADHLRRLGLDPQRSGQPTDEILVRFGDKVRYFHGLWEDELHKRSFGFEQCRGELIIRIDADEHMEIDHEALTDFLESPATCGSVEFPLMVLGELQLLNEDIAGTPRQVMFFKRAAFESPLHHCAYLWLVLSDAERSRLVERDNSTIFGRAVARDAHLSLLRSPAGSVVRARFYNLRWILDARHIPWHHLMPEAEFAPDELLPHALSFFAPGEFESWLEGDDIVSGLGGSDVSVLRPVELSAHQLSLGANASAALRESRAEMLNFARKPRLVLGDIDCRIDVSSMVDVRPTAMELVFSGAPASVEVELMLREQKSGKGRAVIELSTSIEAGVARIAMGDVEIPPDCQAVLVVTAHGVPGGKVWIEDLRVESLSES